MSDTNKNTLTLYNLVGYAYMKRLNDKWFFSIDNINWVSEDDPDFPKVTIMSTPKANPSKDVSPMIQEPQRVSESPELDTEEYRRLWNIGAQNFTHVPFIATDPVMEQPKDKQQEETPQLRYVPETYYNCPVCGKEIPTNAVSLYPASTSRFTSPQQPSTVELEVLYDRIRAGKVPGTDDLHITRSEFVAAINELRRQDMEYVIGKKFDVNQYLVKYGDGEIAYHLGEASVSVTDVLKLRADQRKRLEERLNEPE